MKYTEMELSGVSLDQQPYLGTPKKYFICTSPRSGSFLLCRLLIQAGMGIPHEYFNHLHIRVLAPRFGLVEHENADASQKQTLEIGAYIDALQRFRTKNGIFGAKLQYWEYKACLDNWAGHNFMSNSRYIYLFRKEIVKQAISLHFAMITGKWGFTGDITTRPNPARQFMDFNAIDRHLQRLLDEEKYWRQFFGLNRIQPMFLSYEDLLDDMEGKVSVIAEYLDLETYTDIGSYVSLEEGNPDPSIEGPSKADVYRAYVAQRRSLDNVG